MYARATLLEIDTVRMPLDDAVDLFNDAVLPMLRLLPGFRGVFVLTTPEGRAMLVSFWDTAAQAEAGEDHGWYSDVLAEYMTLFRAPPGRERYEVKVAVPPAAVFSSR